MRPLEFVQPQSRVLSLESGDRLIVRKRLTTGEQRESYKRATDIIEDEDGTVRARMNPLMLGPVKCAAYLLDWHLVRDVEGTQSLRGLDLDARMAAVDGLDPDCYMAIKTAIDAHEREMTAARDAEKNDQSGEPNVPATSPSQSALAGASIGSAT